MIGRFFFIVAAVVVGIIFGALIIGVIGFVALTKWVHKLTMDGQATKHEFSPMNSRFSVTMEPESKRRSA